MEFIAINIVPMSEHLAVHMAVKHQGPGDRYPKTVRSTRRCLYVQRRALDLPALLEAIDEVARRHSESEL